MELLEMKSVMYRRLDELDIAIYELEAERTKVINQIDGLLSVVETAQVFQFRGPTATATAGGDEESRVVDLPGSTEVTSPSRKAVS